MQNRYVLLTAAKNEEAYIGETIASVLRQTVQPVAWFIMDDGSTDRTAQIVEEQARRHPFIRLQSAGAREGRNFGSQYKAITAAYELARPLEFDFAGVHDADIAPEPNDYYESMLRHFNDNPKLGIAGGAIYERPNGIWEPRKGNSADAVAGGVQMFRRACFEKIGGYTPLVLGGSDWLAQIDAKAAGWEVQAFPQYPVYHYRPTSSADGRLRGCLRAGYMDASFGSHPLFELLKCVRRCGSQPLVVGSLIRWFGFVWWQLSGRKPLIPADKAAWLRREQKARLRRLLPFAGVKAEEQ